MSKAGAMVIVMCLLGKEKQIDVEALPWGEEDVEQGFDTVIEAVGVRMAEGKTRDGGTLPGEGDEGEEKMVRAKLVDGVWIKEEEEDEDHFSRSIHMYRGERTFIGVHR
jgi:DEAD/DEAH box helicase domain-containing protein